MPRHEDRGVRVVARLYCGDRWAGVGSHAPPTRSYLIRHRTRCGPSATTTHPSKQMVLIYTKMRSGSKRGGVRSVCEVVQCTKYRALGSHTKGKEASTSIVISGTATEMTLCGFRATFLVRGPALTSQAWPAISHLISNPSTFKHVMKGAE